MQGDNLIFMNRFKEKYLKTVVAQMKEKFGYSNSLAVPKVDKIVLNVRISASNSDQKFQELAADTLTRISGQKPIFTKAKKSNSSLKSREDQIVGVSVTLRNNRMYDFLDKLVNLSLPNVRDFRGLSQKSIDGQGNLTIGFKEYLAFPEINPDEVENLHGLEVCIHTTAKSKKEGFILLALLGFPFVEKLIDK